MLMNLNNVSTSGSITVHPLPITYGDKVHLHYNGFLLQQPDVSITAHVGYGNSYKWIKIKDFKMDKLGDEFITDIPIEDDSRLNICFKGNNGQWDNNNGQNWSYEVHNGIPNIM